MSVASSVVIGVVGAALWGGLLWFMGGDLLRQWLRKRRRRQLPLIEDGQLAEAA